MSIPNSESPDSSPAFFAFSVSINKATPTVMPAQKKKKNKQQWGQMISKIQTNKKQDKKQYDGARARSRDTQRHRWRDARV